MFRSYQTIVKQYSKRHATRNADLFKERYTRILDKIIGFAVICVMGGLCGVVLTICLTGL